MPLSSGSLFGETITMLETLIEQQQSRQRANILKMRSAIEVLDHADLGVDPGQSTPTMTGLHPPEQTARMDPDGDPEAYLRSFLPRRDRGSDGGDFGRGVLGSVLASYLGRR